jgi:uncharacterized SAM-binding protein YcdF (DUF218 family)
LAAADRPRCGDDWRSASGYSSAAPLLVLSDGGSGPVPEAELMQRGATAHGVPPTALLIDIRSRDTFENAREAAGLLSALCGAGQ